MKNYITATLTAFILVFTTTTIKSQTTMESPTTYIHLEKASFTSKAIKGISSLLGVKKGGMVIKKANQSTSTETPIHVPKAMLKKYEVKESFINNRKYWTIKPKANVSDKVILYSHGGVYLFSIKKYHWRFAEEIMVRTQATIIIPDYPLAPSSNCQDAIDYMGLVYQELLLKYDSKNITLIGDSSGGGLTLAFAMTLRNQNQPRPSQIILLSPWLDVTMSNDDILDIDKKDKMLGITPLQIAGKVYAGQLDWKDYRISPIYGDFTGLGKISVFIGTHDLLVADCRKLKKLTEASNISINYFEYPEMFHGWFILKNMKEAKVAKNQISSLILSK